MKLLPFPSEPEAMTVVLKGIRKSLELTQTDVARELGITVPTVSARENAISGGFEGIKSLLDLYGVEFVYRQAFDTVTQKITLANLGPLLRRMRKMENKSRQTKGAEAGISGMTLSKYEKGLANPKFLMLVKLLDTFNINLFIQFKS